MYLLLNLPMWRHIFFYLQDPEKPGMKPTMQTYDVDLNA